MADLTTKDLFEIIGGIQGYTWQVSLLKEPPVYPYDPATFISCDFAGYQPYLVSNQEFGLLNGYGVCSARFPVFYTFDEGADLDQIVSAIISVPSLDNLLLAVLPDIHWLYKHVAINMIKFDLYVGATGPTEMVG
jgi:hypothetical protein